MLAENSVSFLVQELFTSPVADLHPVEDDGRSSGLYMAFLDRELNIRKYRDLFNRC